MHVLGTNIDPDGGVLSSDGVLQVAFDRYLLPATITRQSYLIVDNLNQPIADVPFKTLYDPIARTVTITGPEGPGKPWLKEDQLYKLVLPIPTDPNSDLGGFRAIDRATLARQQARQLTFRAGPPAHQGDFEPSVDFCADVLPLFVTKCAGGSCHGASSDAATSLILETSAGVRETAVNRVAQGSNTAANAGAPLSTPSLFGVNMPIVTPGDPGSSWLLYKVELPRIPTVDAGPKPNVKCAAPAAQPAGAFTPLAPARVEAPDAERTILDEYILGREMPYPSPAAAYVPPPATTANPHPTAYYVTPLDFQERERIRRWIAQGADTRECGVCEEK